MLLQSASLSAAASASASGSEGAAAVVADTSDTKTALGVVQKSLKTGWTVHCTNNGRLYYCNSTLDSSTSRDCQQKSQELGNGQRKRMSIHELKSFVDEEYQKHLKYEEDKHTMADLPKKGNFIIGLSPQLFDATINTPRREPVKYTTSMYEKMVKNDNANNSNFIDRERMTSFRLDKRKSSLCEAFYAKRTNMEFTDQNQDKYNVFGSGRSSSEMHVVEMHALPPVELPPNEVEDMLPVPDDQLLGPDEILKICEETLLETGDAFTALENELFTSKGAISQSKLNLNKFCNQLPDTPFADYGYGLYDNDQGNYFFPSYRKISNANVCDKFCTYDIHIGGVNKANVPVVPATAVHVESDSDCNSDGEYMLFKANKRQHLIAAAVQNRMQFLKEREPFTKISAKQTKDVQSEIAVAKKSMGGIATEDMSFCKQRLRSIIENRKASRTKNSEMLFAKEHYPDQKIQDMQTISDNISTLGVAAGAAPELSFAPLTVEKVKKVSDYEDKNTFKCCDQSEIHTKETVNKTCTQLWLNDVIVPNTEELKSLHQQREFEETRLKKCEKVDIQRTNWAASREARFRNKVEEDRKSKMLEKLRARAEAFKMRTLEMEFSSMNAVKEFVLKNYHLQLRREAELFKYASSSSSEL